MEDWEREWVKSMRESCRKLSPFLDKDFMEKLLWIYCLEEGCREEIRKEIEFLINSFSNELLFSEKPVLECPSESEAAGEIIVGRICQGEIVLYNFGLSRDELNQHMLIAGRSGHGKTVLIMNIISQLLKKKIPFLVFDFKRDFRHLIRFYPIWVFRWENLRVNLLQPPPGVSLWKWEQLFCDLYSFNYGWFHGSRNMLQEYLHQLYEEMGDKATFPKLYQLVRDVEERTRKRQEYYDVVLNRLFSTVRNLGEVIDCEEGFPIEVLLEHPCVIELDGLARDEQNLLVEYFLFWIYAYRLAQGHRGCLRHVLIFDEAKRVFDVNKELRQVTSEMGVAPIDIITDEIREFGEALIVSDQEPSKLTHSIKANTYVKIVGFLGHGKDIDDIAEAMDLSEEEREVITKLERGEWLVKLAGRYTKPFMIRSSDFPVKKDVSDEELRGIMRPVIEKLASKIQKNEKSNMEVKEVDVSLSKDAWELLVHVNLYPFNGMVSRARKLGFSARRIEKAKWELVERNLVFEKGVVITAKKPTKFLVPTSKALKLLESKGFDTNLWRRIGNVGFEHVLYQVLIRYGFEKLGFEAHIEARLGDRRIDVLAVKGDVRIGVEVELNPYNGLGGKLKGLDKLSMLYIVSDSEEKLEFIKRKLGVGLKVRFMTVRSFLIKLYYLARNSSGIYSSNRGEVEFNFSQRNLKGGLRVG